MNEQNNPDPIRELLAIMEQLRAKNGCPWDEQTLEPKAIPSGGNVRGA